MKSDVPLACDMGVFTSTQREAHIQNTDQLIQTIQSIGELENGYQFTFPNESRTISMVAEFISNERLCCPFLQFTMKINSNNEPLTLSLTGPIGTQDFLRAEFEGVFQ
jgi:hypothetical protein